MTRITPQDASLRTCGICTLAPVMPVLVVEDAAHARPLAEALVAGGLPVLEVTLRSEAALAAIKAMSRVPGGHVGAGTVLTREQVYRAKDAGAQRFYLREGFAETARTDGARNEEGLPDIAYEWRSSLEAAA